MMQNDFESSKVIGIVGTDTFGSFWGGVGFDLKYLCADNTFLRASRRMNSCSHEHGQCEVVLCPS